MFIDSHCHLNFKDFDEDRPMVIGNAKKAMVKKFIVPGCDLYFSETAVKLAEENPGTVYCAVGFHPYEATQNPDLAALEKLIQNNRWIPDQTRLAESKRVRDDKKTKTIVAIGECGLDYHMFKGEAAVGRKDIQKRLFEEQLILAHKYNLPVIIHSRDAFSDVYAVLDRLPQMPRGVVHCFSGGLEDVRQIKKRNLFIGLDGNITYSKQLQMVIPEIPLSMMLLETDAPYLTPAPHRGTRNEPKYIPLIAKCVANLQSVKVNEVETVTTDNVNSLFGLV